MLGNFQCRDVLLISMKVGQGSAVLLTVDAGGVVLDFFFSRLSLLFSFSRSLGEVRYKLKYRLKVPLNQKQPPNQPANVCSGKVFACFFFTCLTLS